MYGLTYSLNQPQRDFIGNIKNIKINIQGHILVATSEGLGNCEMYRKLEVSAHLYLYCVALIASGVSHQTSQEVIGHHVIHNVTKFQSSRRNN